MLVKAENQQLKSGVVKTALSLDFPPEEADEQIDTLIEWGRYGELLTYDDSTEEITLETEKAKS